MKYILNDNSFSRRLAHHLVCVNFSPWRHSFSNNFFSKQNRKHLFTTQTQALCTHNFAIFFWHAKLCGLHFIFCSGFVIIVHISWKEWKNSIAEDFVSNILVFWQKIKEEIVWFIFYKSITLKFDKKIHVDLTLLMSCDADKIITYISYFKFHCRLPLSTKDIKLKSVERNWK